MSTNTIPEDFTHAHIVPWIGRRLRDYRWSGQLGWVRWTREHWQTVPAAVVVEAVRRELVALDTRMTRDGEDTTEVVPLLSYGAIKGVVGLLRGHVAVDCGEAHTAPDGSIIDRAGQPVSRAALGGGSR